MAQNKLSDLNNHLFTQLERLNDLGEDEMNTEQAELEFKRSRSMVQISEQIIKNAKLTFEVAKSVSGGELKAIPEQLETKKLE